MTCVKLKPESTITEHSGYGRFEESSVENKDPYGASEAAIQNDEMQLHSTPILVGNTDQDTVDS